MCGAENLKGGFDDEKGISGGPSELRFCELLLWSFLDIFR